MNLYTRLIITSLLENDRKYLLMHNEYDGTEIYSRFIHLL